MSQVVKLSSSPPTIGTRTKTENSARFGPIKVRARQDGHDRTSAKARVCAGGLCWLKVLRSFYRHRAYLCGCLPCWGPRRPARQESRPSRARLFQSSSGWSDGPISC